MFNIQVEGFNYPSVVGVSEFQPIFIFKPQAFLSRLVFFLFFFKLTLQPELKYIYFLFYFKKTMPKNHMPLLVLVL